MHSSTVQDSQRGTIEYKMQLTFHVGGGNSDLNVLHTLDINYFRNHTFVHFYILTYYKCFSKITNVAK